MGSTEDKKQSSIPGVTKWIVLGVVLLVFIFLFRQQIGHLLDRTTSVTISGKGVELKTAETVLGTTTISNAPAKQEDNKVQGIHGTDYVNNQYSFRISWPVNGDWTASETYGATLQQQLGLPPTITIPLVILRNEPVDNFRPNVNVMVESVGEISARQYIEASVRNMENMGWIILSRDIDDANQAGLVVFYNTTDQNRIYQFQRIVIYNKNAYIVTASQLPPDNQLSNELKEELRTILNSFQLISPGTS